MSTEPATQEIIFPGAPDTASIQQGPPQQMIPPNFIMAVQSVQAVDGQELRLPCKVTGKPMPQISWYHNGKNIDQDEEYVITYNPEEGDISLLIVEVFPEDEGEYVCVAHNPAGDAVTRATLIVLEPEEAVPEEPVTEETEVKEVIPKDECVPEAMEIDEEEVKPDIIERPKLVPMVEERPRSPSPEMEDVKPQAPAPVEELPPEVQEEIVQPEKKVKVEFRIDQEPAGVKEEEVKPDVVERPKLVPLEEDKPRSPSPEFFDTAEVQKTVDIPEAQEEQPEVSEEVLEQEVKPKVIERPKPKSIVEEAQRPESPVYEEIGEAPIYEEIPERPPVEAEEEILEPSVKPSKVDRPKPKSIVEEKAPEEPEFIEEITPVKEEPVEAQEDVKEETLVPDQVTKKIELPELPPKDEKLDKKSSTYGEEAPKPKEEIHVEDIYATVDEGETVEEIPPEFVELLQPQITKDGDRVVLMCKVIGMPSPTITWFREGQEITPSSDFQPGFETNTGICVLEIPEVFPEDAGEYACRAVNPFGESVTTANILVEGRVIYQFLIIFNEKNTKIMFV